MILDTVPVNAPVDASNTTEPLCLTSPVTSPVTLPVTLPVRDAVMVPAAKLPDASRMTKLFAELAELDVIVINGQGLRIIKDRDYD